MARITLPSRSARAPLWALTACHLLLAAPGSAALAQQEADFDLGPFSVNDADPVASVPTPEEAMKYPLQMGYLMIALTERADRASTKKQHDKAAQYYLALAKGVPDRAIGFRKACESFEAAGQSDKALKACRDALGAGGLESTDFTRFVQLALAQKHPLAPSDVADVEAVIAQIDAKVGKTEQGARLVTNVRCQLAVRLEDTARLESCEKAVRAWPDNDTQRFVYSSLLAMQKGDWDGARKIVASGQQAGIPVGVLARTKAAIFSREQMAEQALYESQPWRKWWPAALAAALLGLAFAAVRRRRAVPTAT